MKALLRNLWNDESGATMVEYGLMVALIAVVCIAAVTTLGTNTRGTFGAAAAAMENSTQTSCETSGGTFTPADNTDPNNPVPASCTYN